MKKLYVSVDMEAIAGVNDWNEVDPTHKEYRQIQEYMTAEVSAVCSGAFDAGYDEILVKDAHNTARNIIQGALPKGVSLLRGWSGHPYCMMDKIDESFTAAMMIGYHSKASSAQNPMAHTLSSSKVYELKINGEVASEFLISSYTAALETVPVVLLSGDRALCEEAREQIPGLETIESLEGFGPATLCKHPQTQCDELRQSTFDVLSKELISPIELPGSFDVELTYKKSFMAYSKQFYPGTERISDDTIAMKSDNWFDILSFLSFCI